MSKLMNTAHPSSRIINDFIELALELQWHARGTLTASLVGGLASSALLHAYLWKLKGRPQLRERALELIESAVAQIESAPGPSLLTGFTGVAWVIEHFQRLGLLEPSEYNHELDEFIFSIIESDGIRHFDLMHGLTGIGLYGLEKNNTNVGFKLIKEVVQTLHINFTRCAEYSWNCPERDQPKELTDRYPNGFINTGLAHGISGLAGFLGRVPDACVTNGTIQTLVESITRFTFQQLTDPRPCLNRLPPRVALDGPRSEELPSRHHWCNGDLGAALGFYHASKGQSGHPLHHVGGELALNLIDLPTEYKHCESMGVCHGLAGAMLAWKNLGYFYSNTTFDKEACLHFQTFSALRVTTLIDRIDSENAYNDSPHGILCGTSGIGLALLSFISKKSLGWERLLLF